MNEPSDSQQPPSTDSRPSSSMRLQKFLARAGVASRRASETIITQGRVKVNGEVVDHLGAKVDPACDVITVDDAPIVINDERVVLMLNKPQGYVTTMIDPYNRPTVAELVPCEDYPGLFPIGRLDQDTTGLLLFTTDGELGNRLLHPRHHVDKCYEVLVRGLMTDQACATLERGVMLEDGMTAPAKATIIARNKAHHETRLALTIHEGRKHQVKRMCKAVGYPVKALHRIQFGPLRLGSLASGSYRILTSEELAALNTLEG